MKTCLAIASSTQNTAKLAQALKQDKRFQILWCLTPAPKLKGRKKILTKNPLHQWASDNQVPTVSINQPKLSSVKAEVLSQEKPDILLVADFGYYIPTWLLNLPKVAPVNVHPSSLPEWRGSSPGQFVILSGAKISAVSFIVMNEKLDQGPIIDQFEFAVNPNWTSTDYYEHAFDLASKKVGQVLNSVKDVDVISRTNFKNPLLRRSASLEQSHQKSVSTDDPPASAGAKQLRAGIQRFLKFRLADESKTQPDREFAKQTDVGRTRPTPQPLDSPTPLARKLDKDDGFIYWSDIQALMNDATHQTDKLPYLFVSLIDYFPKKTALATYVTRAARALYPWPTLWTKVPTKKGIKRMRIITAKIENNKLVLEKVQIEGQQPALFNQVKNLIEI